MAGPVWTELIALAAACAIAVIATPAGISGAVLLLPFQVSVLARPAGRHPDQPALQTSSPPRRPVPVPPPAPGRRATRRPAHRRTLPGVIGRIGHPRRLAPRPPYFALVVAAVLALSLNLEA